jgi:DNA-binding beta-propeller fold protein YncE
MKSLLPLALWATMAAGPAFGQSTDPLVPDGTIPLGTIAGRIDHLAIDVKRERLFVAELGNDTVGVLDLKTRKIVRELPDEPEAQGLGFVPATDTLYVASGENGTVDLYRGEDLTADGRTILGHDADDIRVDPRTGEVLVGYGGGGIATIDSSTKLKISDVQLPHHPEGFELSADGTKLFVNVPSLGEIAVIDRDTGKVEAKWPLKDLHANFPMAFDPANHRILITTRSPARLAVFRADTGEMVYSGKACGDSDDLFVDAKRSRVYVICGQGFIDTFQYDANGYHRIAHMPTVGGARTGLFSPDLDRLYLAVRARGDTKPAVWIYRPTP